MVRLYWITAKDTGHLEAFRFKETAEKKLNLSFKDTERFFIEGIDTPISDFPEWSWFWELNTPEKEYKNSVLCIAED